MMMMCRSHHLISEKLQRTKKLDYECKVNIESDWYSNDGIE
jgi:hypothetical protein